MGRKKGSVVEIDETLVLTAAISLALLSIKHEHVVVFGVELCHTGVATAPGNAGILDEPGRLYFVVNVGRYSLEGMHVVFLV